MTVAELIEHLKKLPQDIEVWTASDDEGNSYNAVYFEPSVFFKEKGGGQRSSTQEVYSLDDLDAEDMVATDYEKIAVI